MADGMTKIIYSGALPDGLDAGARLIEDRQSFEKIAADGLFPFDYSKVMPDKDHVGIHLIALGDSEHYLMNRNGDLFPKSACINYHHTFVKHGHVHRHHKNKDPEARLGEIKLSAYNEPMGRIELFIHVNREKCAEELTKLEKSGEVPFSMACSLDPKYPVMTKDRGYVPISEVTTNDLVMTRTGGWHKVTKVMNRTYSGPACRLHFYGLGMPLELTEDHLLWMKVFGKPEESSRTFLNPTVYDQCIPDWAHAGHASVNDRVMALLPGRYDGYGAIDSIDLARIMGYYLAEGSFNFNGDRACSVQLSCHMSDSLPRVVPEIVERMLPGTTCRIHPHHASAKALAVMIHNTEFAEFLRKYVGRLSKGKYICPEIFNAEEEIKLAYLGAWLDGDGFVDAKGIHWSTANQGMVLQGRDLLATIGIPSSIYRIDHAKCETSGMENSGVEYTLNISRLDSARLAPWSSKVECDEFPDPARNKPPAMRPETDNDQAYAYRIKGVDHFTVTDAQVYNLEVEADPSYLLAGMISHNCHVRHDRCTICNNLRKSSSDPNMCDHIRYELGKLGEDGRVTGTYNDEPNFFDISFVFRPADRIAWSLKTASDGALDSVKLAEDFDGLWVPEEVALTSPLAQQKRELLHKLAALENHFFGLAGQDFTKMTARDRELWEMRKSAADQALSDEAIALLRDYEPADTLYHLAEAGIVLDPAAFFKYALGGAYDQLKAAIPLVKAAMANGLFGWIEKTGRAINVCNDTFYDVDTGPYRLAAGARSPRRLISLERPRGSFMDKYASHRAVEATIEGRPARIEKPGETFCQENQQEAVVTGLSERYAIYKLAAVLAALAMNPEADSERQMASMTAQHLIK